MKKLLIIIVIIAIGLAIWFWFGYKEEAADSNTNESSNGNVNESAEENKFIHEDFTIIAPAGWANHQITGTLATFYNVNEQHPEGSAAANINFKTYLAVAFDTTADQTLDQINDKAISDIKSAAPSSEVVSTDEETINGLPGRINILTMTQQEVDYKVMMAIILSEEENRDYVVSGSTTVEKWSEYETEFLESIRSFELN